MATFGIDLGTTYSCVAFIDDSGRAEIAKNSIGEDSTPSVVFFETKDNVVVGRDAKNSAKISPELVVSLIKRKMGQDLKLEYHGVTHTPESISALILRELARAAAEYTHQEVRDVVITVPAYFGVGEREATRNAGTIAGLNVLNVVPEPVAAALHYEAVSAGGDRTILVYDLGGGTFDTTVIRLEGKDIRVVCTDGDHHLGGADWDERIAEYLGKRFLEENPGSEALDSEDFLQDLANAAEDIKKALTKVETRRHSLKFGDQVARVEITRAEFERLTSDLLERTFEITRRTIEVAGAQGYKTFDDVLLVGGSTRMPAVDAELRKRWNFTPKLHDPDLAVAKGAALFALVESVKIALPMDTEGAQNSIDPVAVEEAAKRLGIGSDRFHELASKKITAVVPRAFGIRVVSPGSPDADADGYLIAHVLKANAPLPAVPPTEQFGTAYEGQTAISIDIWEQAGAEESPRTEHNNEIGRGLISDLPPLPKNSPIDISFQMDETGTLRVNARDLTTGKSLDIELQIDGGLSTAEVQEARNAVARYTVSA